jgi:hypothetical protein
MISAFNCGFITCDCIFTDGLVSLLRFFFLSGVGAEVSGAGGGGGCIGGDAGGNSNEGGGGRTAASLEASDMTGSIYKSD